MTQNLQKRLLAVQDSIFLCDYTRLYDYRWQRSLMKSIYKSKVRVWRVVKTGEEDQAFILWSTQSFGAWSWVSSLVKRWKLGQLRPAWDTLNPTWETNWGQTLNREEKNNTTEKKCEIDRICKT